MNQFDFDTIDEYQLEITSYCNASCPQCPRNNLGQGINPRMPLTHLDRDVIDRAFTTQHCDRLRQIFFCGSYGDPIMHPDFLEILQDFRAKNPKLWLYIHTNGGVHDTGYWRSIAEIMNGYGQIDFGIDGLQDTLSMYRQNVSYEHVINSATAFIQSGGRAQWNFIVFEHNEHQIETARLLAESLGFHDFLVRRTGRFFNHATLEEMPSWPVQSRSRPHVIRPPKQHQYRNRSMLMLAELKQEHSDITTYFDQTRISCDALQGRKVAINVEGLVLPCNFFNHNLYDGRFYEPDVLPGAHHLSTINGHNQVRAFLEQYGLHNLNIHNLSLPQIFQCEMWHDLVRSWSRPLSQGRIFECAMTCGQKLTKVWDQGGNS
jgi:MoaA/NifB/PqqE/SkfB family radical SAM enzyme